MFMTIVFFFNTFMHLILQQNNLLTLSMVQQSSFPCDPKLTFPRDSQIALDSLIKKYLNINYHIKCFVICFKNLLEIQTFVKFHL